MNIFTFAKLLRAVLPAALLMVGAVWLSGCDGGDEEGGGGGDIVGDWLLHSSRTGDVTPSIHDGADSRTRTIYSYKSTGEYLYIQFSKTGDVWSEQSPTTGTWRKEGSSLYLNGGLHYESYSVSNGELTTKQKSGRSYYVETFAKVNLDDYRRSLGL